MKYRNVLFSINKENRLSSIKTELDHEKKQNNELLDKLDTEAGRFEEKNTKVGV